MLVVCRQREILSCSKSQSLTRAADKRTWDSEVERVQFMQSLPSIRQQQQPLQLPHMSALSLEPQRRQP